MSIFANDLSRRMPALAHRRSTLPHSFVARSTIAVTCPNFEMSAPSAIAVPPALRISSTTVSAGVSDPPVPSRAPPKSLTTTLAPRLASPSACSRPRPLPAPVTIATRPSNLIAMSYDSLVLLPFSPCGRRWREAPDEGFSPKGELAERTPHPPSLREATLSHKGRENFSDYRFSHFISMPCQASRHEIYARLHIGSKIGNHGKLSRHQ